MDNIKTGNFIKELRTQKNLTQKELAEKINVSTAAVSKWENGKGFPDISMLEPLSLVLDTSVGEIIKGEKDTVTENENSVVREMILLSEKERKSNRFANSFVIGIFSLTVILVITYVVFDMWSNYSISSEFFVTGSGFVGLFAFLFGINAIIFGLFNLIFCKKYPVEKAMQIGLFSESCCCGTIWLTSVYTSYKISVGDFSAVLDTAKGLEICSQILFLSVTLINSFAYWRIAKK